MRLAVATLLLVGCSSGYDIEVDARPDRLSVAVYDDACGTRASAPERLWVRLTGDFEFMELLEFSFSSGEKL